MTITVSKRSAYTVFLYNDVTKNAAALENCRDGRIITMGHKNINFRFRVAFTPSLYECHIYAPTNTCVFCRRKGLHYTAIGKPPTEFTLIHHNAYARVSSLENGTDATEFDGNRVLVYFYLWHLRTQERRRRRLAHRLVQDLTLLPPVLCTFIP